MSEIPPIDDSILASARPARDPHRGQRIAKFAVVPLAVLLVVVVLVFYVFYSSTRVEGPSMLETLRPGDRLLVTRSYETPQRGDIVVATIPGEHGEPDTVLKRVIAVEGDTLEVREDVAFVNGEPERDLGFQRVAGAGTDVPPQIIRDGEVFLMGDNRPVSWDSRFVGAIPIADVQGRAAFIFAPVQRMGPLRR